MNKLAIGFVSACLMAYGQQTWNGLKFGMSEDEIRIAAKKLGLKETGTEAEASKVHAELARLGLKDTATPGTKETLVFSGFKLGSFPLDVGAYVGAQGTLEAVHLTMKTSLIETNAMINASIATRQFGEKLTEKYGKPVSSEGECVITSHMIVVAQNNPSLTAYSCKTLWVEADQHIKLAWYFLGEEFTLYVTYEPRAKEL